MALGRLIIEEYYPGDWELINGKLHKGNTLFENNFEIIDQIGEMSGNTVTLFNGDTRVATNVMLNNERLVGTKVSPEVIEIVLNQGKEYRGRADVVGNVNLTAYEPIHNVKGEIIGIWYVGVPATPYDNLISHFRKNMIQFSIVSILLGFLLANLIAYTVYVPLRRTGKYVQKVSEGDLREKIPVFANDEVGQLATMVNAMIDNIHELIDRSKKIIESLSQSSTQLMKSSEMSSSLMEDMTIKAMKMSENTTE